MVTVILDTPGLCVTLLRGIPSTHLLYNEEKLLVINLHFAPSAFSTLEQG
ncbi:hypothetical protein AN958_07091 [Leucoagaricus sp. SymC.cos]|nr:hypothetical protein AN958_07091 [Leucoagaricus sp. SymC.cos]